MTMFLQFMLAATGLRMNDTGTDSTGSGRAAPPTPRNMTGLQRRMYSSFQRLGGARRTR